MRSVFTVDLRCDENAAFPSDSNLLDAIRGFGWEPIEIRDAADEPAKRELYKRAAEHLFSEMPEIAVEERGHVLFFGLLADDQTKFVITRRVEGQLTFRLLHPALPRVQSSTRKMVAKVLASQFGSISNNRVLVYERGFDHVILLGTVISDPKRETLRINKKDALLAVVPLLLVAPIFFGLAMADLSSHQFMKGTGERLSTALITTSIVSGLGLLQTYWDIRRNRLISWNVTSGDD